jgi:hypothetical protein
MIALAFVAGFVCGVVFLGTAAWAYRRGQRAPRLAEVDEDFEWDHPELAHLLAGKAPIRLMPPSGGETLH